MIAEGVFPTLPFCIVADMGIELFYSQWPQYNRRIVEVIAQMSPQQLGVRPSPDGWPVWATVGHMAGVRVYWLCIVVGESGASTTPFEGPEFQGWEDNLDRPRTSDELISAMDSTWGIVQRCLDDWNIASLEETISRTFAGAVQEHTRGSILQRLFSHDAYHAGELSQTLGIHELPQIDLWRSE